ncbi:MAG: hypothetical protein FJ119_09980 [Deltaproteobacteria bacterium]|nr:hypothetical protein [Deltaproteobacteria bacterium]
MVDEKELKRFMLTMTIIWCALLFSLFVYLFVGLYVVKSSQHTGAADTFANIRIILYIMSLIMLFITNPVRKLIINKNALSPRQQTWKRPEFQKYSTAMIVASAKLAFLLHSLRAGHHG